MPEGGWVRVAAKGEVAEGACIGVRANGREIAVYHLPGGDYRATDDICPHAYALLSQGWMENGQIECPLHSARFDIKTGRALCAPADDNVAVFAVKLDGDDVLVQLTK
jgi:nitrite reductase/ring-hydroxylating ferredoxin subunit